MKNWKEITRCSKCGESFCIPYMWCPKCSSLIEIVKDIIDVPKPTSISSIWDFQSFLPKFDSTYSMLEGNTPIIQFKRMDPISGIHVKLENRNPTGNFRDRASSLIISDALSSGKKKIINSTTGSFGISLAAYCAGAGLESLTYVPESTELSKFALLKIFGSKIIDSAESVEDLVNMAREEANYSNAYLPLPNENLLMIEGQKTMSLEIALQNPKIENIILPRGSGSLVYSVYQGFKDALSAGWIDEIPTLYTVALESSEIHHMVEALEYKKPKLLKYVEKIIKSTKGKEIAIDPMIMVENAVLLAKREGLFIDPGSASVITAANMLKEKDEINLSTTCVILTGSGTSSMNVFTSYLRESQKAIWGISEGSTTKFEIMALITENKANYGYAIWKALGKKQSLQSIYQHLNDIERKGYIVLEEQGKKKKIVATKKGNEWYKGMKDLLNNI